MMKRHSISNVRTVDSGGMNRYNWKWNKSDIVCDKDIKVFTTFSCGGVVAWAINEQDLK